MSGLDAAAPSGDLRRPRRRSWPPPPEALDFLLTRRSRPAKLLAPPAPDRAELERLLTAAARVPDHGKLEPWRFVVLEGAALARFAAAIRARARGGRAGRRQGRARPSSRRRWRWRSSSSPKPSEKIPAIEQTLSAGSVALEPAQRRARRRLGRELADRLAGL